MGESPRHSADSSLPPTLPRPLPSFLRRQEPRQTDHPQHSAGPPFALSLSKRPPQEAPPPLSSRSFIRRSCAGGNLPLPHQPLPPRTPPSSFPPLFSSFPRRREPPPPPPAPLPALTPPSSFPPLFSSFPRRREPPPTRPPALATSQPPTVIPAKAGIQRAPGRGAAATNPSRIPHFPPPLASFLRRQESRGAVPGWVPPAIPPSPAVLSCPATGQTGGHTCQPSD